MKNLLKKLVLPISCLGHFLHTLGQHQKMFVSLLFVSVCVFIIYMSICMEKNQDRTDIFLLEIPLIEQSRGLIGE